jgi:hypothetical protein
MQVLASPCRTAVFAGLLCALYVCEIRREVGIDQATMQYRQPSPSSPPSNIRAPSAVTMATSPTENAFQQALKTYKEQLTEKELARIETPTSLDDLVEVGKTLGTGNQKALRLLQAFEAARIHLEPFQGLLQGVCKLSPKGGDLLWASVSFVFEVGTANSRSSPLMIDRIFSVRRSRMSTVPSCRCWSFLSP